MGGKKKQATAGGAASAGTATDDEILNAAIAANKEAAASAAQAATDAASTPTVPSTPATPPAPAKAALTQPEIITKLNAVPTFCVLNGDSNMVAMQDPSGGGGEVCSWFTDADEARRMLASAKEQNPEVAAELHLGVTPLGLAFAFAIGWVESLFVGEMRVQGKSEVVESMATALTQQVATQGIEPGGWVLPTFCCDELQSDTIMPVFLSRADLVAAWVTSGRSRESVPENLAVIELRVLVAQMQTDAFAWSTVQFVGSPRSVEMVREAKVAAAVQARLGRAAAGDEPPPLASDDEPPPLE